MLRERGLFTEGYREMRLKAVSGMMLTLLLIGMLTLAFNIQPAKAEPGTIYIRADGSVDPPTANITTVDNTTYTFTGNINDSIVVERDNIVVDGAGYTLKGTGSGVGINLTRRNNVTIENMKITTFELGISLLDSSNNTISGNKITTADPTSGVYGILLRYSSNNTISGNNITNNSWGVRVDTGLDNILSGNNIANTYNGISLSYSSNCSISGNDITANRGHGINLFSSSNNIISGNKMIANKWAGIELYNSSGNSLSGNYIAATEWDGIWLDISTGNTLSENNLINNKRGVVVYKNNKVYHNNFFDNAIQAAATVPFGPTWDDGYPSGGNYWSNYTGMDFYSGPYQNVTGSDGIGDTAYVIDAYNRDHYPLMNPWIQKYTLTIYSSPTGITFTVDSVSHIAPWSGTYSEGASVSLVMPEAHDGYVWSNWLEDGDPNRIKAVTMDTNITLTGVFTYVPPPSVGGKAILIDKVTIKPELQSPWIWLTTIILVIAVTAVFFKYRKKQ